MWAAEPMYGLNWYDIRSVGIGDGILGVVIVFALRSTLGTGEGTVDRDTGDKTSLKGGSGIGRLVG